MAGTPILDIHFSPSLAVTAARYRQLGVQVKSFHEPLKRAIQKVVIPSIRANFDAGGRPAWQGYADSTIEFHQALGEDLSSSMLVKTGTLRRTMSYFSIWTVTREEASLSDLPANVWYGKLHQGGYGGKGGHGSIPARPFVMLQPQDEEDIARVFDKWLEERITRVWSVNI